ncbi:thioesterase [Aridibaculum aurantiacum]|uniref:thioesterase n=1 Tax=Aridibaculum aurantiacum TaxID=2810307 RepID=UPI001A979DF0|nr:thioesterase [Aridibaculum aurantiacum]
MHHFHLFKKLLANQTSFRIFLLTKLPVAFFCGLRLVRINEQDAAISVRYGWFNTNPFRSMYFAVLSMAGEVSTGVLAMGYLYKRNPSVSMLLVKTEGEFYKKAVGKIVFTCKDGEALNAAIENAVATGVATNCSCKTEGLNEAGEVVASFVFTWSFKARSKKS